MIANYNHSILYAKREKDNIINIDKYNKIKTKVHIIQNNVFHKHIPQILFFLKTNPNYTWCSLKQIDYTQNVSLCNNNIQIYNTQSHDKLPYNLIISNGFDIYYWEKEIMNLEIPYIKILKKSDIQKYNDFSDINVEIILINSNLIPHLFVNYKQYIWKRIIIDNPESMKQIEKWNNPQFNHLWILSNNMYHFYQNYHFKKSNNFLVSLTKNNEMKQWNSFFSFQKLIYHLTIKTNQTIPLCQLQKHISFYTESQNIHEFATHMLQQNHTQNILSNSSSDICSICHSNNIQNPVIHKDCNNSFCSDCLFKWLKIKKTCPLCRKNIDKKDLIIKNKNNIKQHNTKLELCKNIVQSYSKIIFLYRSQNELFQEDKCFPNHTIYEINNTFQNSPYRFSKLMERFNQLTIKSILFLNISFLPYKFVINKSIDCIINLTNISQLHEQCISQKIINRNTIPFYQCLNKIN